MFSVTGILDGKEYRLTQGNGTIGGDELIQYRLRQLVKEKQALGLNVGFPSGVKVPASISSPYAVYALAVELYNGGIVSTSGDVPQLPDVPKGAQA